MRVVIDVEQFLLGILLGAILFAAIRWATRPLALQKPEQ